MVKKSFIYIFLFNFVLLSGCATVSHVPLSKHNSQSIKTVYINPEISKPEKMYQFASGSQFPLVFGALGGIVSGLVNAQAAISTQKFVEKNNIDIKKIVYQRWVKQINNRSKFKLSNQPSDTILITDIVSYGISIPHGFSTDYVPVLRLNARLVRNNQIIWQDSGCVLPLTSDMPRYKIDQIIKDPKILYAMWDNASDKIINNMLTDMSK